MNKKNKFKDRKKIKMSKRQVFLVLNMKKIIGEYHSLETLV